MKRSSLILVILVIAILVVASLYISRVQRPASNPFPVSPVQTEPEVVQRPTTTTQDITRTTTTSTPYFNETNLQGWRISSVREMYSKYSNFKGLAHIQDFVLRSTRSDSSIFFEEYQITDKKLLDTEIRFVQPEFSIGDRSGYFVIEPGMVAMTCVMFIGEERVIVISLPDNFTWPISLPSDIEDFMKNIIVP